MEASGAKRASHSHYGLKGLTALSIGREPELTPCTMKKHSVHEHRTEIRDVPEFTGTQASGEPLHVHFDRVQREPPMTARRHDAVDFIQSVREMRVRQRDA